MREVFLVRHGETDANRRGIVQGQSGVTVLTDLGRIQMQRAADHLRTVISKPAIIWYSPQPRGADSALLFSTSLPGGLRAAPELIQRSWGSTEGKTVAEVAKVGPERAYYQEPSEGLDDDAETTESIRIRLSRFVQGLLSANVQQHIIIAHNELLNYLLNLLTETWLRKRSIANGEVLSILLDETGKAVSPPHSIFPTRIVCVWHDAPSFMRFQSGIKLLEEHDLVVTPFDDLTDPENVVAVVLGDSPFGLIEASRFPELRTVARYGSGTDAIAVGELRSIRVTRIPAAGIRSVAEYVVAAAILLLRDVLVQTSGLRQIPIAWRAAERPGLELGDAAFGIVGCGRIGLETVKLLTALGAPVFAYNRSWPASLLTTAEVLDFVRATSLELIYTRCDVISVHLALASDTRYLFNRDAFRAIRDSGRKPVFINTSRSGVVDEHALLEALNHGWIRAAALDVWSAERETTSEIVTQLRYHPRVLPTPHIAGHTWGALERAATRCAANIVAIVEGRPSEAQEIVHSSY